MDFSTLDKNSSEQLYMQIRRILAGAIRDQELSPGQKIPSVSELSAATGVSRMTVRQALQTLTSEGWLYSIPGKGTFVSRRPRIEQDLQHLMGWTEEIASQGLKPSTRLLAVETIPADRRIARALKIKPGDNVYRITRLRLADGFPLSVERAHLACEQFPNLKSKIENHESLYRVLREGYHVYSVRALQYLEAGGADPNSARMLDVPAGSPVLISERTTYTADDEPVEHTLGVTRAGFLRYRTELSAGSALVQQVVVKTDKLPVSSPTREE